MRDRLGARKLELPFLEAHGDVPTCVDRLTTYCSERTTLDGVRKTLSPLDACAKAAHEAARDVVLPKCGARLGTLPENAPCVDNGQCESNVCDFPSSKNGEPLSCGICGARSAPRPPGETCWILSNAAGRSIGV